MNIYFALIVILDFYLYNFSHIFQKMAQALNDLTNISNSQL